MVLGEKCVLGSILLGWRRGHWCRTLRDADKVVVVSESIGGLKARDQVVPEY